MKENWKAVLGYEDSYEVSDLGRVRSVDREIWHPGKNRYQNLKGRILKQSKRGNPRKKQDYLAVSLYKEGLEKKTNVHILVLESFVGPRPAGLVGLHGPNGRFDNSLSNLSWGTYEDNNGEDRLRDGTLPFGENHYKSKLTNQEVREIYRLAWEENLSQKAIGEIFNLSQMTVSNIKLGKIQSRITGHENTRKKYKKFASLLR